MTHPIWVGVDALTMPSKRSVIDKEGATWHEVPSLWDQSTDALYGGAIGDSVRMGSSSERSPLDVTLMEMRSTIAETTRREAQLRHIEINAEFDPKLMRTVAAYVIGHEPDQCWWYEYRFSSWARALGAYLHAYEHTPKDVRLRNAPCPDCGTRQVIKDEGEGPVYVGAILIDFHDGNVRAAQCCHCGKIWWRGPDLEQLAALLHT